MENNMIAQVRYRDEVVNVILKLALSKKKSLKIPKHTKRPHTKSVSGLAYCVGSSTNWNLQA